MLAGNIGAEITLPDNIDTHAWCFGENQSSYIIATSKADEFTKNAAQASIPYLRIGRSISQQELKISNGDIISLKELKQCYDTGLSNRL
jgi:phosphoribosylformylglycinamidine (FGAM) synthase-like enzyme